MSHLGDANKMVGEDHIRDATKMVSDTPRMNSVAGHARGIVDAAIFAEGMKLERELNAANSRIELLMSANADVARIAGERDAAEKRIRLLIAKLDKYQDRIQRLEEAGDELLMWLGEDISESNGQLLQDAWNKAKEAKP